MFHSGNWRVKWLKVGGALVIFVLLLSLITLMVNLKLSPAEAAPPQVGVGATGRNALEFIGRINQEGPNFTGFGYLTHVQDLNQAQLFTNPATASEATARFTFFATATMTSRAILSDVFVINSAGTMTFYFNASPSGRNFNNPNSFTSGVKIATASMRYHDILLVQGPNKGIATGSAELVQLTAASFTLGGTSYRLGQPGLIYRFSTVGNGTRTDPNPAFPRSFVLFAGNGITYGQETVMPLINKNSP
jgi:hypothetical protein